MSSDSSPVSQGREPRLRGLQQLPNSYTASPQALELEALLPA